MTTVINFYAGPGVGKSTVASGLFYLMKITGFNVELVTEYAKDLVYDDRTKMFAYQEYVFAKQRSRIERLIGKVDFIITDSPINLGHFYMPPGSPYDQFGLFIDACFNEYENFNIYLNRIHQYKTEGRTQTEKEAKDIDAHIRAFLTFKKIPHTIMDADINTPFKIMEMLNLGIPQMSKIKQMYEIMSSIEGINEETSTEVIDGELHSQIKSLLKDVQESQYGNAFNVAINDGDELSVIHLLHKVSNDEHVIQAAAKQLFGDEKH